MREIGILIELNQFHHPNIVEYVTDVWNSFPCRIHEIIHEDRNISIVFECFEWDLKKYMDFTRKHGYKSKCNLSGGLPIALVKVILFHWPYRVGIHTTASRCPQVLSQIQNHPSWHQAVESLTVQNRCPKARRFRIVSHTLDRQPHVLSWNCHSMVSCTRNHTRLLVLHNRHWYLECWMHCLWNGSVGYSINCFFSLQAMFCSKGTARLTSCFEYFGSLVCSSICLH